MLRGRALADGHPMIYKVRLHSRRLFGQALANGIRQKRQDPATESPASRSGPRKRPPRDGRNLATVLPAAWVGTPERPPRIGQDLVAISPGTRDVPANSRARFGQAWLSNRRILGRPPIYGCRGVGGTWPHFCALIGRALASGRPESDQIRSQYRQKPRRALADRFPKIGRIWP